MKDKNIFSAIGNIDEKYIEEAAEEKARLRLLVSRCVAAAAAFLLVVAASIAIFTNPSTKGRLETNVNFLGLNTMGGNNVEHNDSVNIDSELMLEDENAESIKSGGEKSDALPDNKNPDFENNQSNTSTTRPNGVLDTRYISVYISLENGCYYHYDAGVGFSAHNIPPITEDNLGEKIGVLDEENINRTHLVGCEIYRHKQIDCDALVILKYEDELVPFVLLPSEMKPRVFSEMLDIYGIDSSSDIEKITTQAWTLEMEEIKTITDSEQIEKVYNILKDIEFDNGANIVFDSQHRADSNKTYIYFKLHFKNGLTYRSVYCAYPNTGYIVNHEFLTSQQNETLREILLN